MKQKYSTDNADLVERILNCRARCQMSQKEFAEHAGVSTVMLARLEAHPDNRIFNMTRRRLELALDELEKNYE